MSKKKIINDITEGQLKAVPLQDGTLITVELARKAALDLENTVFQKALTSYREKLQELPPPPPGYYYAPKIGKFSRQDVDKVICFICEGYISLEPIIKE